MKLVNRKGPASDGGPKEEEEAITPCTRDYVATNGWLSKGSNRLTSGTARNPCFKKAQKCTLSVPSTLGMDGIGMRGTRE
jgi:hypothetical protein